MVRFLEKGGVHSPKNDRKLHFWEHFPSNGMGGGVDETPLCISQCIVLLRITDAGSIPEKLMVHIVYS